MRKLLWSGLIMLTLAPRSAPVAADLYPVDSLHWLYIGWENDYPKSFTFMGGSLAPAKGRRIQYTVTIDGITYFPDERAADRRAKIRWYLRDGYMPCPVSEWSAGPVMVAIQHFARRILNDAATAVYTRVTLSNTGANSRIVRLNVNSGPEVEVPLGGNPSSSDASFMRFESSIAAGASVHRDFVTRANGTASVQQLTQAGGFEANYTAMADYYKVRIDALTHPVRLPDERLISLYKSCQTVIWESMVKRYQDYEIRGSAGNPAGLYNYDRTFSHDVPNIVEQSIREGDFALAKDIMQSSYYQALGAQLQNNYLDAIPKYIIPYAQYLQVSGDRAFFTASIRESVRAAARRIPEHRYRNASDPAHDGIMNKSNTFDNGSHFLLVDNFAALHGLAAYRYLCRQFGDSAEARWAHEEMSSINTALDRALNASMTRRNADWYMSEFDDNGRFYPIGYSGNWIGTTLMMPSFPWGAMLRGMESGGVWWDRFERSLQKALELKAAKTYKWGKLHADSWGAWWGNEYGTVYNGGMGLGCLASETYRTLPARNLLWMLDNQSAPMQWGESFNNGDWTRPAFEYETWGLSFNKQTLLELCASVKTDGTVIIGRGIPDDWVRPGKVIEWVNVYVNNNRKINFTITGDGAAITLKISGDTPQGNILFNLPLFKNNIASASTGVVDRSAGTVTLAPGTTSVTVTLATTPSVRSTRRKETTGVRITREGNLVRIVPPMTGVRNLTILTDAQGRLVRQWDAVEAVSIDTRTLEAGTYLIHLSANGSRQTKQLTVTR